MKSQVADHPDARTRLLNAALRVIRAKGYADTSVDELCRAAGVTKGAFFHHFKTKEDLALVAADHFAAMAAGLITAAPFNQASDPLDRLLGYIEFRGNMIRGELPDCTCLLGTMVQETYETHPAIRVACDKHISEHAAGVARDIAAAKVMYAPEAPWSAESLGLFTQAVLQGAFVLAKAKNSADVAFDCIGHLMRYVEGLFSKQTRAD
ncbi:MAG: TetR/AcrR family transcriptional regulator [Phycisphaerales bacterium]|nr:TetR/AcrR family transcriptional regulator [Phycisphaerales bacterium]